MANYIEPLAVAEQLALHGQFQDAADLMDEMIDRTRDYVCAANTISYGEIKAAAQKIAEYEAHANEYALQASAQQLKMLLAAE